MQTPRKKLQRIRCTEDKHLRNPQCNPGGDRGGHVTVVERRVPNCTVPAVVISGNSNEEPNRIIEVGVGEKSATSGN